jgi:hypothetical protein
LIRFDEIFGNGVGQIPLGAKIENAVFTLTTGESSGSARSGGPYGVAQLLVPFTDITSWFDFLDIGPTFTNGEFDRPHDQGFRGPMEASTVGTLSPQHANVTRIVQNWSDGQANEGLVVRAGTTDGWQIFTSGALLPELRPRLEVTYSTEPQPPVQTVVLQQGTDNYTGTTMARLNDDGITDDGELLDKEFLDGATLTGSSPDRQALIKFENIFARDGGPVPDDALITEGALIIDTAPATFSQDTGTNGSYAVHQMLVDWDLTSVYSDFGTRGPNEEDGEVAPPTDLTGAMIADTRAYLDVTEILRNWQMGDPSFGFAVRAFDTSDGWAIHWLGSDSPPQLMISYTDAPPMPDLAGDYNGNGRVEQADLDLVLLNWGTSLAQPWVDGTVDQAELDSVLLNWGNEAALGASAGVPEPATWLLAAVLLLGLAACHRVSTGAQ